MYLLIHTHLIYCFDIIIFCKVIFWVLSAMANQVGHLMIPCLGFPVELSEEF